MLDDKGCRLDHTQARLPRWQKFANIPSLQIGLPALHWLTDLQMGQESTDGCLPFACDS